MLKKLLISLAVLAATSGYAFAQIDVNKADQAALDGVKGIGPKMSKAILDERKKGGEFKNWTDLEGRVKGVGEKNAIKLSEAGLTVNGQARQNGSADNGEKKDKATAKESRKEAKKDEAKK